MHTEPEGSSSSGSGSSEGEEEKKESGRVTVCVCVISKHRETRRVPEEVHVCQREKTFIVKYQRYQQGLLYWVEKGKKQAFSVRQRNRIWTLLFFDFKFSPNESEKLPKPSMKRNPQKESNLLQKC